MSRYQKGKTNLDFTEARDSEWQWHQLEHMQVCTSLQTDNHAITPPLSFLQAGCPSCQPTNSVKALKASKINIRTMKTVKPNTKHKHCVLLWLGNCVLSLSGCYFSSSFKRIFTVSMQLTGWLQSRVYQVDYTSVLKVTITHEDKCYYWIQWSVLSYVHWPMLTLH